MSLGRRRLSRALGRNEPRRGGNRARREIGSGGGGGGGGSGSRERARVAAATIPNAPPPPERTRTRRAARVKRSEKRSVKHSAPPSRAEGASGATPTRPRPRSRPRRLRGLSGRPKATPHATPTPTGRKPTPRGRRGNRAAVPARENGLLGRVRVRVGARARPDLRRAPRRDRDGATSPASRRPKPKTPRRLVLRLPSEPSSRADCSPRGVRHLRTAATTASRLVRRLRGPRGALVHLHVRPRRGPARPRGSRSRTSAGAARGRDAGRRADGGRRLGGGGGGGGG